MGITVSIVSHGHGETVEHLLQQMADLSAPRPERVIVTLNQPEPVLAQGLRGRNWPFDLVLTENAEPLGFGANHNRAFALDAERGSNERFAVVNPDIRLRGNPFGSLLAALGSVPHAGLAYPVQVDEDGRRQDHERLLPTPKRLVTRHLGHGAAEVPTGATPDWVNAAFLLLV
ncbi:MAG: glycosyltransferase family 2 protein, partial [Ottowia sp.]|nr:glycosyltransferase family 2 protein [Ottowia sp.]